MVRQSARSREAEEEARLRAILKDVRDPLVKGYKIEFGEDSTGGPAVWVWLLVDDDSGPQSDRVQHLSTVTAGVRTKILREDLDHWPYVGLRVVDEPKPA